jgi:hypothetical protein
VIARFLFSLSPARETFPGDGAEFFVDRNDEKG